MWFFIRHMLGCFHLFRAELSVAMKYATRIKCKHCHFILLFHCIGMQCSARALADTHRFRMGFGLPLAFILSPANTTDDTSATLCYSFARVCSFFPVALQLFSPICLFSRSFAREPCENLMKSSTASKVVREDGFKKGHTCLLTPSSVCVSVSVCVCVCEFLRNVEGFLFGICWFG